MSNGLTATRQADPVEAVKSITFLASLPPIMSAITFDGSGDGARIKLDIPSTDSGAILLLHHHGIRKLLRVTIEFIDS